MIVNILSIFKIINLFYFSFYYIKLEGFICFIKINRF
ncbi:Uncharacterised protein [Porphyromonas macacae]|uniref:Uncharacterized protein n=1 Tax=Porphyromonas macacae TaxID=28115 RepID=A0A379DJF9_9PORP|nr:Uncharacterised protein [Porphyromonas macacae]